MTRRLSVSQVQDQLLETALDLDRMLERLSRCCEDLGVPPETAHHDYEAEGRADGPPAIELALADEINAAIDDLRGIADGLRQAAGITEASLRDEWRKECDQHR